MSLRNATLALLVLSLFSANLHAESQGLRQTFKNEADTLPQKPSAPSLITRPRPIDSFSCARQFQYRGKLLNCDSVIHQDAEMLRPILQDVPEAVQELNTYQRNRRTLRSLAYVGSAGLLLMIIGKLSSGMIDDKDENKQKAVRNILMGSGALLAGGTLFYGLSIMRANEDHLENAVNNYNKAKPNDPIELKFTATLLF